MTTPQHGIFALGTRAHHLQLDVVGEGDGLTDRLTDFSRSTGGAWYVAPPVEAFADWRGEDRDG